MNASSEPSQLRSPLLKDSANHHAYQSFAFAKPQLSSQLPGSNGGLCAVKIVGGNCEAVDQQATNVIG